MSNTNRYIRQKNEHGEILDQIDVNNWPENQVNLTIATLLKDCDPDDGEYVIDEKQYFPQEG